MELNNTSENRNIIDGIIKGSIAEELGIKKGDILLTVNGEIINDIIDFKYHITDDFITMSIMRENEVWEYEIEKDYDEDIGISFTNPLIDKAKSCKNKCMFCFIDQLPKNMRKTLYFKDDDSRLSFLQGNFVTLTNMSEEEINRIIRYRISPINVSVHTTNPELRIKMLRNKNAGNIYNILKRFNEADIKMNCQIVLVPGVNDDFNLDNTISDLEQLYPNIESLAVVPVGLTSYRENLDEIMCYDNNSANYIIKKIEDFQEKLLKKIKTRFVYASDEFYLLAEKDIPKYDDYEGFPQIENGVGLLRLFRSEVENILQSTPKKNINASFIIPTGTLAYSFINDISNLIMRNFKGLKIKVVPIINNYFGETITVSGLLTGEDIYKQLKDFKDYDKVIIPSSMLKCDEEIFLDNLTVDDLEKKLNKKIIISEVNGEKLVDIFINERW